MVARLSSVWGGVEPTAPLDREDPFVGIIEQEQRRCAVGERTGEVQSPLKVGRFGGKGRAEHLGQESGTPEVLAQHPLHLDLLRYVADQGSDTRRPIGEGEWEFGDIERYSTQHLDPFGGVPGLDDPRILHILCLRPRCIDEGMDGLADHAGTADVEELLEGGVDEDETSLAVLDAAQPRIGVKEVLKEGEGRLLDSIVRA